MGDSVWFRQVHLAIVASGTAKSRAPDHHERQPKNEFWTNFKRKVTWRKALMGSISDNFFSTVGAHLEVLGGCQG
jgi:hypothetical protein